MMFCQVVVNIEVVENLVIFYTESSQNKAREWSMGDILWQSILDEIELSVSHANFTTWFKPTQLVDNSSDSVTISVPNIFAKQQFESRFNKQIKDVLEKNGVTPNRIIYKVASNATSRRAGISREILPSPSIQPIDEIHLVHTNSKISTTLNPRYTFDSFIVGSSNDLAYTACRAVTDHLGSKYNPLFIYGGVGLGKTHLVQAVGNEVLKKNPKLKVLYVSSETFVKEFLDSIRFKKAGFSDKYRGVDVLIVDDMQFIAGKEKTQEEFFHTFNALHQVNKQIIICSDKPPRNIPTLTERLRSRLEWGMAIDIQMPDFETRCAILQAKAAQSGVELDRETVEYIAENIRTNIRELEGALNHLLAYTEMRGMKPDVTTAEGLLGDIRHTRPQHLTPKNVIDRTAQYFQLSVVDLCSAKRDKHIVQPRQIAMYLLRSELHMSFPRISHELGRKDHTTAIHSVEKISKAIKLDYLVREQVSTIREQLYV